MFSPHPAGVETAFKAGNKYRVLTTFPDSTELVEEYDAITEALECRRWRSCRPFGGAADWEYEIGDPAALDSSQHRGDNTLCPNLSNPTFHKRDTRKAWKWHVRNLPYPEETYNLSVNDEKQELVIRTLNKKYFKVFKVPALIRAGIALQRSSVRTVYDGGSMLLKISYDKPDCIIDQERRARESARNSCAGGSNALQATQKKANGVAHATKAGSSPGGQGGKIEGVPRESPPECKQS